MSKFKNKYRIESARAAWWNYGWAGAYFITICTRNRQHYFGEVKNGKMILSRAGVIADILWYEIPNHAHSVGLDSFVVMPNHLHGIIILDFGDNDDVFGCVDGIGSGNNINNAETRHSLSLQQNQPLPSPQQPHPPPNPTPAQQRFQNQGKNTISSIIGSYKSAVTKHANRLGIPFGWQTRFHDHIIRTEASYLRISDYIENNPGNWDLDRFSKSENP